jgi:16S rRNA (guanine(527)-N(7))-methyltransferase RsmG
MERSISNQEIADILREYSVVADAKSSLVAAIQVYISLLLRWNRSISLTTVTDPEEIVRFHFGESFLAASAGPITSGRLADVGSGAGFPGLPLKMLIPALDLVLVESNAKKATFLAEVVRKLALDRVRVFRGRMEELSGEESAGTVEGFDFITARAFGQFGDLLVWASDHLNELGRICLWLGEDDLAVVSKNFDWSWGAPIRIPGSTRRFILTGSIRW